MRTKILIGKSDKASFPEWEFKDMPVKIDTGAYRCSIDCNYAKVKKNGKQKVLHFTLLREDHPRYTGKVHETSDFITSKVKSSNGIVEKRYVVRSTIELFGKMFLTEFSLTSRNDMKFPILLGRKLLNANFIVDTSRINLSYRLKRKKRES